MSHEIIKHVEITPNGHVRVLAAPNNVVPRIYEYTDLTESMGTVDALMMIGRGLYSGSFKLHSSCTGPIRSAYKRYIDRYKLAWPDAHYGTPEFERWARMDRQAQTNFANAFTSMVLSKCDVTSYTEQPALF